jgi:tRNA G26 N,N-dimethylase Trm1
MNIDEMVEKAAEGHAQWGTLVFSPDTVKQLIRDVLEEVKPEPKDSEMAVKANSPMWGAQIQAHNRVLEEMEANAKRIGL